jgi:hypothetical protein
MADAPFMYWVGMNTQPDTSAEELAKFNDFYSHTHVPEVVANNPGFIRATRYELQDPDPRGNFGPRWLVIYEMDGEQAAQTYLDRNDGPPEGRPSYTAGPAAWQSYEGWWRLIWHRLVPGHGELAAGGAPYLYFVAMNVPPDTDARGLQEFNDFYTNIHVPEVVAMSAFRSGIRYELHRDLRHPEPGAPRFLAVYEADETSRQRMAERRANPGGFKLSSGPPAWEAHDTLWRLWYRRLDSYAKP